MPVTITEEIINGADSEITDKGETRVRAFHMAGLTSGTAEATKAGLWDEVYNELRGQKGVFYGAAHPFNGALACSRIKPSPFLNSRTQARVLATYVQASLLPGGGTGNIVRFRSLLERIQTARYPDKSLFQLTYTPPGGQPDTQVITVSGTKAVGELIIEREVTTDPEPHLVCVNKLNAGTYRGQAKWTWLCEGIDIDPIGSSRWREVARFAYDEQTHNKAGFWLNKSTGDPPADVIGGASAAGTYNPNTASGNGFVNAGVNGEINFANFGF